MPSLKCLDCHYEATTRTANGLLRRLVKHAAEAHRMKIISVQAMRNINEALNTRR
ncbi:MAG: DUF1059 domain-containing protein [Chloroflexi bacterium]|nr:DUF1059 domain-containing protein [Chloroflexota bacterium]